MSDIKIFGAGLAVGILAGSLVGYYDSSLGVGAVAGVVSTIFVVISTKTVICERDRSNTIKKEYEEHKDVLIHHEEGPSIQHDSKNPNARLESADEDNFHSVARVTPRLRFR